MKKGEKGIQILAPTPYKIKVDKEKLDPDTKLPMLDDDAARSLNLSNAVAVGTYEVLRQWGYPDLSVKGSLHRLHWDEEDAT